MTDTSLLLFAAARGARIQQQVTSRLWVTVGSMRFKNYGFYRVHPNDIDLIWGPLSRQYSGAALYGNPSDLDEAYQCNHAIGGAYHSVDFVPDWDYRDDVDKRMTLLLIAQALQSEGL